MPRPLIILITILVLIGIGVGVWFFFFRTTSTLVPGETSGDPFGNSGAGTIGGSGTTPPDVGVPVEGAGEQVAPRFYKISNGPVAEGVAVFNVNVPVPTVGTSTAPASFTRDVEVRYVERANGNLYRFQLGTRVLERMTNQTLPGIQEALFASDGSRAFVRFAAGDRVETYALPADGSEGYVLQSGLSDVVVTGTSTVLTVLPGQNGSIGTRATLAGGSPTTVFSSPLSSITLRAAGQNYAAYTKPSRELSGQAFSVSRLTGEFTRILGALPGLAVLPNPAGTKFLYSAIESGTVRTSVIDLSTRETIVLPIATMVEKCTWSLDGTAVYCGVPQTTEAGLPDAWYQGSVSTSDRLWKVDMTTRVAELIFDPVVVAEIGVDAVALATDPAGDVLVFTNKRDGSLWLFEL